MRNALPVLAIVALSACTSVSSNYTGELAEVPAERIIVCSGHDCTIKTPVPVTPADAKSLAAIMIAGRGSAGAERQAVGKAIQYFEERAASVLGRRDTAFSQFRHNGVKGEMDCIDEATNSQSLLRYLASRGLLRHHTVQPNRTRGFLLDGRYPHSTAVIKAGDGREWAVDSWVGPTGAPVSILPLEEWMRGGSLARELEAAF